MTKSTGSTFEVRPQLTGFGWYIVVIWPTGRTERIDGFESEQSAREWIRHKSSNWVSARASE